MDLKPESVYLETCSAAPCMHPIYGPTYNDFTTENERVLGICGGPISELVEFRLAAPQSVLEGGHPACSDRRRSIQWKCPVCKLHRCRTCTIKIVLRIQILLYSHLTHRQKQHLLKDTADPCCITCACGRCAGSNVKKESTRNAQLRARSYSCHCRSTLCSCKAA